MSYNLDSLLMCNCADCGEELLGRNQVVTAEMSHAIGLGDLPRVCAGKIRGRPYCSDCLDVRATNSCRAMKNEDRRAGRLPVDEEPQPS